jgi:hypothetical protein
MFKLKQMFMLSHTVVVSMFQKKIETIKTILCSRLGPQEP